MSSLTLAEIERTGGTHPSVAPPPRDLEDHSMPTRQKVMIAAAICFAFVTVFFVTAIFCPPLLGAIAIGMLAAKITAISAGSLCVTSLVGFIFSRILAVRRKIILNKDSEYFVDFNEKIFPRQMEKDLNSLKERFHHDSVRAEKNEYQTFLSVHPKRKTLHRNTIKLLEEKVEDEPLLRQWLTKKEVPSERHELFMKMIYYLVAQYGCSKLLLDIVQYKYFKEDMGILLKASEHDFAFKFDVVGQNTLVIEIVGTNPNGYQMKFLPSFRDSFKRVSCTERMYQPIAIHRIKLTEQNRWEFLRGQVTYQLR